MKKWRGLREALKKEVLTNEQVREALDFMGILPSGYSHVLLVELLICLAAVFLVYGVLDSSLAYEAVVILTGLLFFTMETTRKYRKLRPELKRYANVWLGFLLGGMCFVVYLS